jgi:hypothetical protein
LILALWSLTAEQEQRIAEDVWREFGPEKDHELLALLGALPPRYHVGRGWHLHQTVLGDTRSHRLEL